MNISRDIKQKFYHSRQWMKYSDYKLSISPFCECDVCQDNGYDRPSEEVHHIISIDDDWDKRFDLKNLMSVSKECHSRITMSEIKSKERKKKEDKKYDDDTLRLIDVCKIKEIYN